MPVSLGGWNLPARWSFDLVTRYWPEHLGPTLVRVYFESDLVSPTFYVWLDGRLFGSTTAGYMDVPVGIGQVAQVDVFDDANAVPDALFPAQVTLLWEVGPEVAVSRVEQWDGDAEEWVVRAQVPSTGAGIGRWESAPLADGETHVFRVVPVDGTARDGIAREFSGVMCRWPDRPELVVGVSGGEFVIS